VLTRSAWEAKFVELEAKLLGDHRLIGQAVGVPFLFLLYPPPDAPAVEARVGMTARGLRDRGVQVTEIDCASLVLETFEARGELDRIIAAERRDPRVLRDLGLGPIVADALRDRVRAASEAMRSPGTVFLTRLLGLHPFATPRTLQERLIGEARFPIVFFVPADPIDESYYLFAGSERTLRYRGVYL
jgi:hypothetical protein